METRPEWAIQVLERLDGIEASLTELLQQRTVKDFYTTAEVATLLGRSEFTVREYCRHGRINCQKKYSGRGKFCAWAISHDELLRIQREGLLPLAANSSTIL